MKSKSAIQNVKEPETFFPIITKYFQEEGVIRHLQAKFLVEISRAVKNSNKHELNPMKAKLIKKGVSSEFAIQFVLHFLKKKNLSYTINCGEIELPNFFIIYQTTTTISNKLKLHRPPSEWLTEVLSDHKEKIKQNTQENENFRFSNQQDNNFDIDFDSENSFDKASNSNKNDVEMLEEENEYYSDIDNIPTIPNPKIANKPKLNIPRSIKPSANELYMNSNSS